MIDCDKNFATDGLGDNDDDSLDSGDDDGGNDSNIDGDADAGGSLVLMLLFRRYYAFVPLYHCVIEPLCLCVIVLSCYCVTALWLHFVIVSLRECFFVLLRYCAMQPALNATRSTPPLLERTQLSPHIASAGPRRFSHGTQPASRQL